MLQPRLAYRQSLRCYNSLLSTRSYASAAAAQRSNPTLNLEPQDANDDTQTKKAVAVKQRAGHQFMRTYKPRTPGLRHLKRPINDHLWKGRPVKSLTIAKKGQGKGGRNNSGRVTVRHRGGGHKRRLRVVDFHRNEPGLHTVERIEYDPNRSAHLALLVNNLTKKQSYIIAAHEMREGDMVQSYRAGIPQELIESLGGVLDPGMLAAKTVIRGNCLPIHMVPTGTQIYCLGSTRRRRAVFCRSAGTYGMVISKEDPDENGRINKVTVRMQSGELRTVDGEACATIGQASNIHSHFTQLGKAGRSRWLGIRPTVRGVAMNASDHPHGGGRGKSKGNRHPVSPWGQLAKGGYKTRRKNNEHKFLVKDRERNQGKRRKLNA